MNTTYLARRWYPALDFVAETIWVVRRLGELHMIGRARFGVSRTLCNIRITYVNWGKDHEERPSAAKRHRRVRLRRPSTSCERTCCERALCTLTHAHVCAVLANASARRPLLCPSISISSMLVDLDCARPVLCPPSYTSSPSLSPQLDSNPHRPPERPQTTCSDAPCRPTLRPPPDLCLLSHKIVNISSNPCPFVC